MDDLLKVVKTYRFTASLDQRLRLGNEIFRHIAPRLTAFVYSSVAPTPAPDVLQETFRSIATSLRTFKGDTEPAFWAWCYRIARNRITDHIRRNARDRLQTMPEDELRRVVESAADTPKMSTGARHDLDFALKLLASAKPECRDLLWAHYVQGFDYGEIAEEKGIAYDAARMKISRCLAEARDLLN